MSAMPNQSCPRSTAGALDLQDHSLAGKGMTKVRHLVFFMIFIAVVINYMDRANFTVSVPLIEKQFGFDIAQMGRISFVWGLAYAFFNFPGGWFADKLGIRKAASFALGWWSIFTILSALAYSMVSWCVVRGLMGAAKRRSGPSTPRPRAPGPRRANAPRLHPGRFGAVRRFGVRGLRFGMDRSLVRLAMDLHHLRRRGFSGFQSGFSLSATLPNPTPGSTSANSASSRA